MQRDKKPQKRGMLVALSAQWRAKCHSQWGWTAVGVAVSGPCPLEVIPGFVLRHDAAETLNSHARRSGGKRCATETVGLVLCSCLHVDHWDSETFERVMSR